MIILFLIYIDLITPESSTASTNVASTIPISTITTTLPAIIISPNITFSFSQLSSTQTLQLLNSNYDMSGCIVNCSNHGTCKFDSTGNKFVCICDDYFTGTACQTDSRACSSNPCLNNATCVDVYSNSTSNNSSLGSWTFSCECQKSYEGVFCQNKINICANETCSSNGVCEDVNNVPKCKCFSMYDGEKCNIQSSELKAVKTMISMTSVIAIIVLICFYLIILIMDLIEYWARSKRRTLVIKKGIISKYVYIN